MYSHEQFTQHYHFVNFFIKIKAVQKYILDLVAHYEQSHFMMKTDLLIKELAKLVIFIQSYKS